MTEQKHTQADLEKLKNYSKRLRIIVVLTTAVIIGGMYIWFQHDAHVKQQEEQENAALMEAQIRKFEAEQAARDSLNEIERKRQQRIADSIRIANMPSYTFADVREMVTARVPSYSWIYLWRMDNDNWIMRYEREYGGKEHWFMQRFNPTTRKFEKAVEYSTVYYPNADVGAVYSEPKNVRCRFEEDNVWGTLVYWEDGVRIGVYRRKDIESISRIPSTTISPLAQQRIRKLQKAQPEWMEEGYESVEDYYYDNQEDMYLYYER